MEDAYLHERNPELVATRALQEACLEDSNEVGGRTYLLVEHFRQGLGQWWVLHERSDLAEIHP